jgi:heme oxygenase (biliverdin-IX-beta and delta-forming)
LRAHTADSHDRLDRSVGLFDAIGPYKTYLQHTHAFRAGIEPALATFSPWSIASLATVVRQDLDDLDTSPLVAPFYGSAPDSDGHRLGMAYVLEGSGLGARLLVKRAAELGLSDTHGARHLAAQTDDPARWRAFLALLDGVPHDQFDEVLAGAEQTFQFALSIYAENRT